MPPETVTQHDTTSGKLHHLLETRDMAALKRALEAQHPADAARFIESLGDDTRLSIFNLLDPEFAGEVILELPQFALEDLVEQIAKPRLAEVVEEMESDDAADVLGELPDQDAQEVLRQFEDAADAGAIRSLLKYPERSAGGIMQTELVRIGPGETCAEAIEHCRVQAHDLAWDRLYFCFITRPDGTFEGVLPIAHLILADPKARTGDLMTRDIPVLRVDMDQAEAAEVFKRADQPALPVVDTAGHLVGRVTNDDILDVVEEERGADMMMLAGAGEDEHALDSPWIAVRKRLPWLVSYLLGAGIYTHVIQAFHSTIETAVVLASYMPVVTGMGGNAGTQCLAVVVRGLAVGEITRAVARRVLLKELAVGLLNGLLVGAFVGAMAFAFDQNLWLGAAVAAGLTANMVVAGLFGTTIPLALKAFGVDPAHASGVLVTMITDNAGFAGFLAIAHLMLDRLR